MSSVTISGIVPGTTMADILTAPLLGSLGPAAAAAVVAATSTVAPTTTPAPTTTAKPTTTPAPTTTAAGIPLTLIGNNVQFYGPSELVFSNMIGGQAVNNTQASTYIGGKILQNGVSIGNIKAVSQRGANPNNNPAVYITVDAPVSFNPSAPYSLVMPVKGGRRRGSRRAKRSGSKRSGSKRSRR